MIENNDVVKEIHKNKVDEYITRKELEDAKRELINSIDNGIGDEIKNFNTYEYNKPIKIKKPLFSGIKNFFRKLGKTFGI